MNGYNMQVRKGSIIPHVFFIAKRLIKKGEEITIHYGGVSIPSKRVPCRCGCSSCCGFIPFSIQFLCFHDCFLLSKIFFEYNQGMKDKGYEKKKKVFSDDDESMESDDLNQLHVNKEYKEK